MTALAEGELAIAVDQVRRLVDILRRSDAEYCGAHEHEPVTDEEWNEVLAEAEDYLEEIGDLLPGTKGAA
jgi:hypothetical protein